MRAVALPPSVLRLVIPGKFWDSQIYSGTLYVFGLSGELLRFSWPKLVADLQIPSRLRVAADLALLSNRMLYETSARRLLSDPDIRLLLQQKINQVGEVLSRCAQSATSHGDLSDNLLPFPHNDSEVYQNTLYVGASDGLFSVQRDARRKTSRNVIRHSDAPALGIAGEISNHSPSVGK
jgi:hypothetical protein